MCVCVCERQQSNGQPISNSKQHQVGNKQENVKIWLLIGRDITTMIVSTRSHQDHSASIGLPTCDVTHTEVICTTATLVTMAFPDKHTTLPVVGIYQKVVATILKLCPHIGC